MKGRKGIEGIAGMIGTEGIAMKWMKATKGIRAGFDSASPSLATGIGYLCCRLARYPFYRFYRLNPFSLQRAIPAIPFIPLPIGAAA